MVAAADQLAARAGDRAFALGGNAVDAAIATNAKSDLRGTAESAAYGAWAPSVTAVVAMTTSAGPGASDC
jgi:hypothetical protein